MTRPGIARSTVRRWRTPRTAADGHRKIQRRTRDKVREIAETVALIAIVIGTWQLAVERSHVASQARQLQSQATERTLDQRANCRHASRSDVVYANLQWQAYLADRNLAPVSQAAIALRSTAAGNRRAALAEVTHVDVRDVSKLAYSQLRAAADAHPYSCLKVYPLNRS